MIKNFFTIALRILAKYKLINSLNILGLAAGMTTSANPSKNLRTD